MASISLENTYANRRILLFGGLGFLGKVLLLLFLHKIPTVNHIYLILRTREFRGAEKRFLESVHSCPAFAPLREQFGTSLDHYIREKVTVIEGDLSLPDFGIQDRNLLAGMKKNIDLVINAAGLVAFQPDFREAFNANLQGTMHVSEFVKQSEKSHLLHVSTCYVYWGKNGYISEELQTTISPNGKPFNILDELKNIEQVMRNTREPEGLNKVMLARALNWGWPNIYNYTKALGEAWLDSQKYLLKSSIVRPSILEGALSFPFPGWNQGFNTSAPLLKSAESGFPFVIVKKEFSIDILPVDLFAKQMIKIGAALLNGSHHCLYQCASSSRNPLSVGRALKLTRKRHRMILKSKNNVSFLQSIGFMLDLRAVSMDHPFSPFRLRAFLARLPRKLIANSKRLTHALNMLHTQCQLTEVFRPFTYDINPTFESNLIDKIEIAESGWDTRVEQIDWDRYWVDVHMPGVEKWCYPFAPI